MNKDNNQIILSSKNFDTNNPELQNTDPKVIEFHKQVYDKMCQNLGLDPSRGQIVLERSPDDDTGEDDTIAVDIAENKAILGQNEFDSYKKFMEKMATYQNKKVENKTLSVQSQLQETLKMILQIENIIAEYLKNNLS